MRKSYLFAMIHLITSSIQYDQGINWDTVFAEQIDKWITHIAHTEDNLSHWNTSTWNTQSLGPNSRQWLVTLTNNQDNIGYLIISVDQNNQPILLHYGEGSFPLQ